MKQKEIVLIAVVVIISGTLSLVLTNTILVSKKSKQLTAEVVDPIGSEFPELDPKIFNKGAINPTKLIQIGDTTNPDPF